MVCVVAGIPYVAVANLSGSPAWGDGQGYPNNACNNPSVCGPGGYATGIMGGPTGSNGTLPGRTTTTTVGARHFDGSNFLAFDGHVKWFGPDAISPGQSNSNPANVQGAGGSGADAAGTTSMKDNLGNSFALTFSLT